MGLFPVLALVVGAVLVSDQFRLRTAPATALESLPRLGLVSGWDQFATNEGGFRLPAGASNGHTLDSSPIADIAYNAGTNTMYVTARNKSLGAGDTAPQVTEISVPAPVLTSNVTLMNSATYQGGGLYDPIEGYSNENDMGDATEQSAAAGLLVYGGRLIGSVTVGYDAANIQTRSHYSRPLALATTGGLSCFLTNCLARFWDGTKNDAPGMSQWQRYVNNYITNIPSEWQPALGGPVLFGGCCLSISNNQSMGPSAFAGNPSDIGTGLGPHTAHPLVFYPVTHQTLGPYDSAGTYYGQSSQVKSVVFINNTRTVLFFGSRGQTFGYGDGLSDPGDARIGTSCGSGCIYQYDPTSSEKSNHGYPYEYFVHAYDALDFKRVKDNLIQPWDVVPYAGWSITFPIDLGITKRRQMTGASYNPATKHLYLNQISADPDGFGNRGVVWRFLLDDTP